MLVLDQRWLSTKVLAEAGSIERHLELDTVDLPPEQPFFYWSQFLGLYVHALVNR